MSEHLFIADILRRMPDLVTECSENRETVIRNLLICHGLIQPSDGVPDCDDWMQTFTGKKFFPLNPNIDDIDIDDIAHGLSNICRFNGQSKFFYSVAQHAVLVSRLCKKHPRQGLHHDDPEAFLTDIVRPVKKKMPAYKAAEAVLWRVIAKKFDLPFELDPEVHQADQIALMTEKRDVMSLCVHKWALEDHYQPSDIRIVPMTPMEAKQAFLDRYYELASN